MSDQEQASVDLPQIARAIRSVQDGTDREGGFRLLYETYCRPVRRLFLRRRFSPVDAEELTQETFFRVDRAMEAYDHRGRFGAWLFTIAESVAQKERQRRFAGKRRAIETPYEPTEAAREDGERAPRVETVPPAQELEAYSRERRAILDRAVATLPERQRQCLSLTLRGHTYREVGTLLRISPETVKRHLAESRRTLRDALSDLDLGPLTEH